ncbi:MAG TPA: glycosyltransferase family 2 protein [Bryobacteraceae bacterium]|nr:glycosyltransferase family 2 protein [Bryobacteraceae bacterium]
MPELTIVVPTVDERANVVPLLEALGAVLHGIDYEVIFVDDDSADGTAAEARQAAQRDPRVRVLERIGRRGLSSAVIEGMLASSAPYLAVMDSDLQHDEAILPAMLEKLKKEQLDLVIGTRHIEGGSVGDMAQRRVTLSHWGRRLSALVCHADLSDPMSGYFVVTREYLDEVARSLSCIGFKVLLDLVVSARRPVRIGEVPYQFRQRLHGRSKLDILVSLEYLELLADKLVGDFVPASYVVFGLAGSVGILAHLAFVQLLRMRGMALSRAQLVSSVLVIGINFVLNNKLTFRRARLSGWNFAMGLAIFYAACSVGLYLNLRVLEDLTRHSVSWYVAAAAGLVVGSVWNYWMSALFVWQVIRRRRNLRN